MIRYKAFVVVLALAILGTPVGANAGEAARDLLRYVPMGAEMVLGVDIQGITESPGFQKLWGHFDTTGPDAAMANIQQATGVHLLHDIQAFVLVGQMQDDEKKAVIIQGRWDPGRLVGLVSANPTYSTHVSAGLDVHAWRDADDGKMTYAAFLRDDLLVVTGWEPAIEIIATTAAGEGQSLEGLPTPTAADGSPAAAFLLMFPPPSAIQAVADNPFLAPLRAMALGLSLESDWIVMSGTVETADARSAKLMSHMLRGLIATGELLDNGARQRPWRVVCKPEGARMHALVGVPLDNVLAAIPTGQRPAETL